ncbi:Na+ dependent nucleoside transporter C-terminus-domain-containing protein [Phycomyces nitens]|nr:Na+ dependent nucleoside transporter C-terminus-domain-containing protein [Phycomyces nitens]
MYTVDVSDNSDIKNASHISYDEEEPEPPTKLGNFYRAHIRWFHLAMWLIFTGFLAAAYALQVPKGYDSENLILGLIYAWFSLYVFFAHFPTSIVTVPFNFCVNLVGTPIMKFSRRIRELAYGSLVLAVIIITIFSLEETETSTRVQRLIALFGMIVFLAVVFLFSSDHKAVKWNTISGAMLLQFLLALFVFRSGAGQSIFSWLSTFCEGFLGKAKNGTSFVFGAPVADSGSFAVGVLPAVIFFGSVVQVLYYMGALQWILQRAGKVFMTVLGVSGAESIVACASPFLGQCENAMLIRPFLPHLTTAEMHQIMTSGFATISGSVLYGYIAMGVSGQALLTSCVMSIPCSIAISKLRYPEVGDPLTKGEVKMPASPEKCVNLLHAAGVGASIGMNVALLIVANLISLLALLYAVNAGLTWIGNFITIHELTLQLVTGYVFVPIAWLIGADNSDLVHVGQLMAYKIWANEFVAYDLMTTTYKELLTPRSTLVCTYALCGFANLGSVGMQIGVLSTLAPKRGGDISRLAASAMICGAFSTWVSASIAGMLS